MIVVFSYSYGLSGAEVGIAGGSAVLGQKLLEAVFGDQAVRTLAERARKALEVRVRELFAAERARYAALLDTLQLDPEAPEQLRARLAPGRGRPLRRALLRPLRLGCAHTAAGPSARAMTTCHPRARGRR